MANPITARQISEFVQNLENFGIDREDFQVGVIGQTLKFAQFIVDAVNPHKATRLPKESGKLEFPSLTQQAAALMEAIPGLQATWPEAMEEAKLPDGADGLALLPKPSALLCARYDDLPPADSSDAEGIGVRLGRLAQHATRSNEATASRNYRDIPLFMREPHDKLGIGLPTPAGKELQYSCFALPVSLGVGRSERYTLEDMRYMIDRSFSPRLVGLGFFHILCMMIAIPDFEIPKTGIGCPGNAYKKMPYAVFIGRGDQSFWQSFVIRRYDPPLAEKSTLIVEHSSSNPCDWAVAILPE